MGCRMSVRKFQRKTPIEAIQWDGTRATDDELFNWAIEEWGKHPRMVRHVFLSFLPDNDFTREEVDALKVEAFQADGYSAVLLGPDSGDWMGVNTGDWIVRISPEEFRAIPADEFVATYEPIAGGTA